MTSDWNDFTKCRQSDAGQCSQKRKKSKGAATNRKAFLHMLSEAHLLK